MYNKAAGLEKKNLLKSDATDHRYDFITHLRQLSGVISYCSATPTKAMSTNLAKSYRRTMSYLVSNSDRYTTMSGNELV